VDSIGFFYFEGNSRKDPILSFMTPHRLENYLRTYRKKAGLSQREVAFLLGCEDGAQISRYEKRHRLPPLETALACEAIYGVPIAELFAGIRQRVGRNIEKRRLESRSRLEGKMPNGNNARVTAQKLRWLADRERPLVADKTSTLS
jgi:transcriptional regulator with XRE-family HTH domain